MNEKLTNVFYSYLINLENLKVRKSRGLITEEFFEGARQYNFKWLQDMKTFLALEDRSVYGSMKRNLAQEEKNKYEYVSHSSDGSEYKEKPFALLEYRGEIIPIYSDDYGQQDFAVYNGEIISGGAYNFHPEEEFAYVVDKKLEEEFLEAPLTEDQKNMKFFSDLMKEMEGEDGGDDE